MSFLNVFLSMPPQAAEGGNPLMSFAPFVLIIIVFYFFMIRPQMKRQKELRKYREALKKGDKVITTGGIYGKVAEVKDQFVTVEIADGVKVKMDKSAIVMDMSDVAANK
ncbi:preprotein translocase subunit YajC [Carboxylicivirga mesophila]|uniref:Sec translocon accessory complex subunit YajC n=2 Tax=Carboxylicivirga TaxID=1628153 RepID=A0A941J022_9BACT|nr:MULTISPECIES: preprotein translocase subunit YajC [Carboxylicivirga]MBR8538320.1 preprotein translocase subunit YajC [Carboxylicivirga sediminis]MBS2213756.1 preprotein translocase subunit YajC [Carboxylicivirga mesophila]